MKESLVKTSNLFRNYKYAPVLIIHTIYSISYWTIGEPPSDSGAVHDKTAAFSLFPITVGLPGVPKIWVSIFFRPDLDIGC